MPIEPVKIIASGEQPQPSDWKELFKDDIENFPRGVFLRESATLACGRTLPPMPKQPMDAFGDWETTAQWRWPNKKKIERSQSNFTRRHWEAESAVCGALQNGDPANVFSENYCDQHPISASWWWAIHGCEKCKLTQLKRQEFFKEKPSLKDPDSETGEIVVEKHPLLRPPSPIKTDADKSRKLDPREQRSQNKRHQYIVEKYPYRTARKGTDTNPNMWTYQKMKTKQEVQDLCRKWTKPLVRWH